MSRKGSILVVDDLEEWRELLINLLEESGYNADAAATIAEAREKLHNEPYHVAILDIRMVDSDADNVEGMGFLEELAEQRLIGALKVVMLSAYGTRAQMREAFARRGVEDFVEKDRFGTGDEFLGVIEKIFAEKLRINLGLSIIWDPPGSLEELVGRLRLSGNEGREEAKEVKTTRITREVDDLLCRLLEKSQRAVVRPLESGASRSGVLWVQSYSSELGSAEPVVVKLGDFRDIELEYNNFKTYVEGFLSGAAVRCLAS